MVFYLYLFEAKPWCKDHLQDYLIKQWVSDLSVQRYGEFINISSAANDTDRIMIIGATTAGVFF